jgi:hypothetical protein
MTCIVVTSVTQFVKQRLGDSRLIFVKDCIALSSHAEVNAAHSLCVFGNSDAALIGITPLAGLRRRTEALHGAFRQYTAAQ